MSGVIIPQINDVRAWVKEISGPTLLLFKFLPDINTKWYEAIDGALGLIQLSHYKENLHHKGAHLFYKIVKNHYFIDGNKRSAVIVIYLYYLVNGYIIREDPEAMLEIARKTAESDGTESEKEIGILEDRLNGITVSVITETDLKEIREQV